MSLMTRTSASPAFKFDATDTIGALEIGALAAFALFGITCAQTYIYYSRFRATDPLSLRLLVAFIWVFESAHTICIAQVLYTYTVTSYGDPTTLLRVLPAMALSVILSGIITAVVQSFFAFRIWVLGLTTGNVAFKIIPVWLWTSEFVYLMASAAATGLAFEAPSLPGFLVTDGWLVFTAWILNLVNDTTITASLVVLLVLNRSRGVRKTTALVDKLITWTIETGLITSLFSVLNLIFYVRQRSSFIWLGIQFVKARLFANSLLASLNSRTTLRDLDHTVADDTGTSFDLDSGGGSGAMTGFNCKSASTTASTSQPSGTMMRVSLAASPELLEGWEDQDYVLGSEQAPTRQSENPQMPV